MRVGRVQTGLYTCLVLFRHCTVQSFTEPFERLPSLNDSRPQIANPDTKLRTSSSSPARPGVGGVEGLHGFFFFLGGGVGGAGVEGLGFVVKGLKGLKGFNA